MGKLSKLVIFHPQPQYVDQDEIVPWMIHT